ncbi:MAG: type II 3-dehydroquinate dehydratase [Elusimicrobiota bacterium]
MKTLLVIHGPNLNLLGRRNPEVYGVQSLDEINLKIEKKAKELGLKAEFYQSSHEGEIVNKIGASSAGALIINPAAFTHTSVAIRDALEVFSGFVVEVHLSNIFAREDFRRKSLTAAESDGIISGFGPLSYVLAVEAAERLLSKKE